MVDAARTSHAPAAPLMFTEHCSTVGMSRRFITHQGLGCIRTGGSGTLTQDPDDVLRTRFYQHTATLREHGLTCSNDNGELLVPICVQRR